MKNFKTLIQAKFEAKKKIRLKTFKWLEAAAENGFTREMNTLDLNRLKIKPSFLAKVGDIDIKKKIFGQNFSSPIIISPMGHQTQFRKMGEVETARGAYKSKTLSYFSTQGRMSLKDIKKNNTNLSFGWEIFPFGNLKWIEQQLKDAEKYKCNSIVLCVDANTRSHRHLDRETSYDARKYGNRTNPESPNPSLGKHYGWELVKYMTKKTKLPVIIKGILTLKDAEACIKNGASGIWVSNHGGRMFNSGISAISALRKISNIKKKYKTILFVDGGIEKGSDVIKYLCAGADLVGIGRAAIYGLILDGENGVSRIIEILKSELQTAMVNGGFKSLKSFNKNRIYE
jgi:isopentenyl diphosphate isomerase/L-lactate dehydrogenase-like FMN-dependent dehydrogenase